MSKDLGKTIAGAIGDKLRDSGALDHLVDRGKDPDYEQEYIYNHFHAWLKGASIWSARKDVEHGARLAHKVKRGDRGVGYDFEFVDEPGVAYCTNYGWSFVPNTPDNRMYLELIAEARERIRRDQGLIGNLTKRISLK